MPRKYLPFILLTLLLLPLGLSQALRSVSTELTAPVSAAFTSSGNSLSNFFTNLFAIGSLREEKQALQAQVLRLEQQSSDLEALKRENSSLKLELKVQGVARELPKQLGKVLVKGTDPLDRTYLVSIGSNQGIKLGQPVIREGYLVGKVIEVRKESCVVRSVLSPLSIIQVWIPTLNEKGYLQGDGNTLTVKDITQGVAVPEGSLVESSGLGGTLPQGLLIGTTGKLLTEPSDLAQNYRLTPGTDPSNLESIMILLTD